MALQGTLDTMTLPDLLQWLGTAQKTGVLKLAQGGITKTLYLEGGLVTGSSSDDPSEFLGQFLLSYGRITEEQLRDTLNSQQGSSEYLGALLVRKGTLSEAELTRMLAIQTEETIYSLFHWDRASFRYGDSEAEKSSFPVALRVDDILLKGARRYDEMLRIRDAIPSQEAVPRRTSTPLPLSLVRGPHLRRLAEAVDGRRSVAAIALHTHTSEFLVSKFLYELLKSGMIEIALPAAEPVAQPLAVEIPNLPTARAADEPHDLGRTARMLFEAGNYEAVLTLADAAPADASETLRGLVQRAEERFIEKTYESRLMPTALPQLARTTSDLLREKLSTEEYFIISRIDGTWDVRSIIAVAPLREVDAIRVLLRLKERGLITLGAPVATARG